MGVDNIVLHVEWRQMLASSMKGRNQKHENDIGGDGVDSRVAHNRALIWQEVVEHRRHPGQHRHDKPDDSLFAKLRVTNDVL